MPLIGSEVRGHACKLRELGWSTVAEEDGSYNVDIELAVSSLHRSDYILKSVLPVDLQQAA